MFDQIGFIPTDLSGSSLAATDLRLLPSLIVVRLKCLQRVCKWTRAFPPETLGVSDQPTATRGNGL